MIVIICGAIGRSVTGGQAWANLQYLLGLRRLGHDVYYLEDSGDWATVYHWERGEPTSDLDYPASYIRDALEPHGFAGRWMYRVGEESRGLEIPDFRELCAAADLLIMRGVPFIVWRNEYDRPRRRVFIDVDPGFTQFRVAGREPAFVETVGKSERLFTVGQRIGQPDCPVPTVGRDWIPTPPPVCVTEWRPSEQPDATHLTTIIRWRGLKDITYDGVGYGQRDRQFPKYVDLPERTAQPFRVALTGGSAEVLEKHRWEVVPGWEPSRTTSSYREFIDQSRGEFSVAKHCYVATRGGWLSDRTVCYLACGRPAIVEDTGLGDELPRDEGFLSFRDPADALRQIDAMNADYERHRRAARSLAETYFATDRVLPEFLEAALG